MNGPEHYREAERILGGAVESMGALVKILESGEDITQTQRAIDNAVALAQVHATLALVAATAEPIAQAYDGTYDTTIPRAWSEVIS